MVCLTLLLLPHAFIPPSSPPALSAPPRAGKINLTPAFWQDVTSAPQQPLNTHTQTLLIPSTLLSPSLEFFSTASLHPNLSPHLSPLLSLVPPSESDANRYLLHQISYVGLTCQIKCLALKWESCAFAHLSWGRRGKVSYNLQVLLRSFNRACNGRINFDLNLILEFRPDWFAVGMAESQHLIDCLNDQQQWGQLASAVLQFEQLHSLISQ